MAADTLSQKSMISLAHIVKLRRPLVRELHELEASGIWFEMPEMRSLLAHVQAQSFL